MARFARRLTRFGTLLLCGIALAGCGVFPTQEATPESAGLVEQPNRGGPAANINRHLWQAAIDTVTFMRIVSTDPRRGTITTDWYGPPEAPYERFRLVINVLGPQLRSTAVRVAVYHLRWDGGRWVDAPASPATAAQMENAILARARLLRLNDVGR